MKNKTKPKKINKYLFFLIYIVFVVPIFIWLFLDRGLPHWDMGRHLFIVLQYRDLWKGFATGQINLFELIGFYTYYPPLIYQLGLAFFVLFGASAKVAVASNIVWIFTLFFSVYQIAQRIYKNQIVSIASVISLGAAPFLIGQAREFQIDPPLTAIVALSVWLILCTEQFSDLKYSIYFGIAVGFGMLTKWTFAFYILPLVAIYFTYSIIITKKKIPVLLNFIYTSTTAILISGYWYFVNREALQADFGQNGIAVAKIEGDPTGINIASLTWYIKIVLENYLFVPLFIVYLAGLAWTFIRKKWRRKLALILILTPIYYLIFSILPNKDTRYLMPLIPLLAVTGICVFNISKNKYYQVALLVLLITIFFINNLNIAFSKNLNWQNNNIYLFNSQYLPLVSNNGYTTDSPRAENCSIELVMESVPDNKTVRLFGPNLIDYNNWMVAFYAGKMQKVWAGESENYLASDYLIYRNLNINELNLTAELKNSGKIKLINIYDCADGGRIELYKSTTISN